MRRIPAVAALAAFLAVGCSGGKATPPAPAATAAGESSAAALGEFGVPECGLRTAGEGHAGRDEPLRLRVVSAARA